MIASGRVSSAAAIRARVQVRQGVRPWFSSLVIVVVPTWAWSARLFCDRPSWQRSRRTSQPSMTVIHRSARCSRLASAGADGKTGRCESPALAGCGRFRLAFMQRRLRSMPAWAHRRAISRGGISALGRRWRASTRPGDVDLGRPLSSLVADGFTNSDMAGSATAWRLRGGREGAETRRPASVRVNRFVNETRRDRPGWGRPAGFWELVLGMFAEMGRHAGDLPRRRGRVSYGS
jgi:hypothetical protein